MLQTLIILSTHKTVTTLPCEILKFYSSSLQQYDYVRNGTVSTRLMQLYAMRIIWVQGWLWVAFHDYFLTNRKRSAGFWFVRSYYILISRFGNIRSTTLLHYLAIQCLQKRYRPVGEIIEEIQSRFNISLVVQCSSHSSASSSTSAFHVLSARRWIISMPR